MQLSTYLIFALGFLAQFLFFIRTILQWFKSEQEGEIISPVVYWQVSLFAAILMVTYGILRNDFAIVLGQFIVYFVYIRNLQLKNAWRKMLPVSRILAVVIPVVYVGWLFWGDNHNLESILKNEDVAFWLLVWGSAGQLIFTFRFIYQWIYSEKRKDSVLPVGFWIISTVGALMIFTYSIFRVDPVLFLSNLLGLFIYVRNIFIHYGKTGLFNRIKQFPALNSLMKKVSDRIK